MNNKYKHGEYKVIFRKKENEKYEDELDKLKSQTYTNEFDDIGDGKIQEPENTEPEGEPGPGGYPGQKGKPVPSKGSPQSRDEQAGGWSGFSGDGKAESSFSDIYSMGDYRYGDLSKVIKGEGDDEKTKDMGRTALDKKYTDSFENLIKDLPIFNTLNKAKQQSKISNQITNWKKELKSYIDIALDSDDKTSWGWDRRHVGRGTYIDRSTPTNPDDDSFETMVLAIDTSGSISKYQIEAFINEMIAITGDKADEYGIGELIIIYCDDNIKDIDRIEVDGFNLDVDWNKLRRMTQGGNSDGFHPPFKWLQENNIKPSVMIYFTDLEANVPSPNLYGINDYKHKVIWWLMKNTEILQSYEQPPFGKYTFCPLNVLEGVPKNRSKI